MSPDQGVHKNTGFYSSGVPPMASFHRGSEWNFPPVGGNRSHQYLSDKQKLNKQH